VSRLRATAAALAASFAACCVAVRLGAFTSIDQWAVDHVMPWVSPFNEPTSFVSVVSPITGRTPSSQIPADLWLYPASVPVSLLLVAGCCAYLHRRGRTRAALAWAGAWLVANVLETLGKHVLTRPSLTLAWHGTRTAIPGFDDSFPSGHATRAIVVAALVALLWPRVRPFAFAWLAVSLVLLVVTNWHVPSDVLGGALLAGAAVAVALELSDASPARAPAAPAVRSVGTARRPST
jgi:membrane-associated phospholipid phosphatase